METSEFRTSLHGLPYNDTVPANPPIQGTNSLSRSKDKPSSPNALSLHNLVTLDPATKTNGQPGPQAKHNGLSEKKSSTSLRATQPSMRDSQTSLSTDVRAPSSLTSVPSIPQIRIENEPEQETPNVEGPVNKWLSIRPPKTRTNSQKKEVGSSAQLFEGLALDLPAGSLGDDLQSTKMEFSNRGSMFLDGRKVSPAISVPSTTLKRPIGGTQRTPTSNSMPDSFSTRVMSTDDEVLSERVRLNYAYGSDMEPQSEMANRMRLSWMNQLGQSIQSPANTSRAPSTAEQSVQHSPSLAPSTGEHISREEMELAGGLEDWQDIEKGGVDRYGFIIPKSPARTGDGPGIKRSPTVSGPGLQRVSTSLQLAAETPRRKKAMRRASGDIQTSSASDGIARRPSTNSPTRPSSSKSATAPKYSTFRSASNILPGQKHRRIMNEASDMFTLPHELTAEPIARTSTMDSTHSTKSKNVPDSKATSIAAKRKEMEREEKWRKMARPINSNSKDTAHKGIGGGMMFSFPPTTDSKLISRTWKGIPDTWRAPAWHYFLSVSARKNPQSLPDDKLIRLFYDYQDTNSPDDVQIDIDVPRTISSHIMFRRRYRGGQRLLFRVLHAMSLHRPETGYVQGMAALAATLLSYYEEEKAFVMLVRLWECRGLAKLYKEGFGGLMEALNDFEQSWLGDGEVSKKLTDLGVGPTAYGTKWYLTLFNYSIPFPAQLRVWDVFMLLGDNTDPSSLRPSTSKQQPPPPPSSSPSPEDPPFGTTLDVLHATSAALIDGMRDILLDSDFENAMKVLTSWIPIRDEDLFMRVAHAEWKVHLGRRRKR